MAQQHLDRLSALDASFLLQESAQSHMHIGALAICAGPPPTLDDLRAHIGGRMHLVPRYRQRLAHAPLHSARPLWVDDPGFRLDLHVHHAALPSPAGRHELHELLARVFSTALDRGRPLWELWLVEGLEDGSFALIFKSHHALIDGRAGVDLAQVVFDASPTTSAPPDAERAWTPRPSPGPLGLLGAGAAGVARAATALALDTLAALRRPEHAVAEARAAIEGLRTVVSELLDAAPKTPLNVPIGPYRRFATVSCRLDDLALVRNTFGATVNDVALASVTGALRRFLIGRGVATDGLELRALVPVSVREAAPAEGLHELGNRVSAMRAPLPVYLEDPLARLQAVRAAMGAAKESPQSRGVEVLAGVLDFAPPIVLAQASRLNVAARLFNLLVTNVPGPRQPLYVLGRRMLEAYPVAPLPREHALAVAILSYDGGAYFGLLGDLDALPETEELAVWIGEEVAALVDAARAGG